MLVIEGRGKPERPEKNLSVLSREPTNSASLGSNPDHIGGRRVLGPPRHPSGHLLCRKQGHKYNINQIPSVAVIKSLFSSSTK